MTMAPAMAQTNNVYAGQTTALSVAEVPGDAYKWELYNDVTGVNFAVVPGNCPGQSAFFTGGINIGSTVNVTWLTPGTYFFKVTAYQAGCTMNLKVGKMIVKESLLTATIAQPPAVCMGKTAKLNITLPGTAPWGIDLSDGTNITSYSNISVNPFNIDVSPAITTSYTVTRVRDAYQENSDLSNTVTVTVNPNPYVKLSDQDTLCSEQAVLLDAGQGFTGYRWKDGSTSSQVMATSEGLYWVVITDNNGCQASDTVVLRPCQSLLWVPNVFSPNGDGLNDEFQAKYDPSVSIDFNMLIFNKWGEQIFSTNDINQGWDGTFKGKPCPPDLYTWVIRFKAHTNYNFSQKSPIQGNVMLLK